MAHWAEVSIFLSELPTWYISVGATYTLLFMLLIHTLKSAIITIFLYFAIISFQVDPRVLLHGYLCSADELTWFTILSIQSADDFLSIFFHVRHICILLACLFPLKCWFVVFNICLWRCYDVWSLKDASGLCLTHCLLNSMITRWKNN